MTESVIGAYGPWAAALLGDGPGQLSLRTGNWHDLDAWRAIGRARVMEKLAPPPAHDPVVETVRAYAHDGLWTEELRWTQPGGPPTHATLLRPADQDGPLPGVLAFHDHGGMKVIGHERIADTDAPPHPITAAYRDVAYGGVAWANELARRGYVVLAADAFPFASRRVRLADVPESMRRDPQHPERTLADGLDEDAVRAYDRWAGWHESIMAKSLFSAGTSWPGVWLREDITSLDILIKRPEVDPERLGCVGLSLGGLRTVYMGGLDPRIKCAVCAGMMMTWRDLVLNKSVNHTWMIYIPRMAHDLDYPEILGLRAPLPTLVLNNREDPLFTLPEMERADRMLTDVFARAGAPDRYETRFYPGGHKFDLAMQADAFDWFDRWLKDA